MKGKTSELVRINSVSTFPRYDENGLGVVSSPDGCDVRLSPPSKGGMVRQDSQVQRNYVTKVSLGANIILLIVKVVICYLSGSLAFIASAVDSLLDLVSQTIIFCAMRGNANVDERVWPLGRSRLEPVGIVVVASIMGMASLQVVLESFARLVAGIEDPTQIVSPTVDSLTIGILLMTIAAKFVLYVICQRLASTSDTMAALAQDHRNDVLSNAVALLAAWLASKRRSMWYLDPAGAIGISIFIVSNWIVTAREQTDKLVGRAAEAEFTERVHQIVQDHDTRMSLDVCRAYHVGHKLLVEVEVVMPQQTTLRVAHDVALALQQKIELLEEVERCHVHVDYDFRTEPEHKANFLNDSNGNINAV